MNNPQDPNTPAPPSNQTPDRWPRTAWRRLQRLRTFAVGVTIGILVLCCVWVSEGILRPHAAHNRAKASLAEINDSLQLALERRRDLLETMNAAPHTSATERPASQSKEEIANPQTTAVSADRREDGNQVFPPYRLTVKELERYRRAAYTELYDIDLRIAGMLRRGTELVRTLGNVHSDETHAYSEICERTLRAKPVVATDRKCPVPDKDSTKATLDGLFDAVVTPNSYSQTVFHVGSLGLIFLGYLAIGAGILSVCGALLGVTLEMFKEFVYTALKATGASIGPLVAGVVGVGAVAAGVSAATVASLDKSNADFAWSVPDIADTCLRTACCGEALKTENATAPTNTYLYGGNSYTFGELARHRYFNDGPSQTGGVEQAITQLAEAVGRLNAKDPQVVRVPITDPKLVNAIIEAGKTVGGNISDAGKTSDRQLAALLTEMKQVAAEVTKVGATQRDTLEAMRKGAEQTNSALIAVAKTSEQVNDTTSMLLPVVDNTLCQRRWLETLNSRNGFRRLWDTLSGKGGDPCKSVSLPGDRKSEFTPE